jgi:cytochrome oxidase Cu insertion factor (SCO1/SenC/PrrC family)
VRLHLRHRRVAAQGTDSLAAIPRRPLSDSAIFRTLRAHERRSTMIRTLRIIRWVSLALTGVLLGGIAALELRPRALPGGNEAGVAAVPGGVSIGGPFYLTDQTGRAVTDADIRGRWMLVYFGYTNCPDACPLALQKMTTALKDLGPLADRLAPIFITVDPARDTPDRLAAYLRNFDPRIIGLTGSSEQIADVAKAYRVYYAPNQPDKSGAYLVGHSSFLYLLDPAGRFNALLPMDSSAGELTVVLRSKLSRKS